MRGFGSEQQSTWVLTLRGIVVVLLLASNHANLHGVDYSLALLNHHGSKSSTRGALLDVKTDRELVSEFINELFPSPTFYIAIGNAILNKAIV